MSMTKKLAIAGILSGACLAVHAAPVTYLAADNPDGHPNSPAYGHLKLPHLN